MVAANAIATAWCLPSRRPGALAPARPAREPNNRRCAAAAVNAISTTSTGQPCTDPPASSGASRQASASWRQRTRPSAFSVRPAAECSAERVGQQCVEPRRRSVACIDQPGSLGSPGRRRCADRGSRAQASGGERGWGVPAGSTGARHLRGLLSSTARCGPAPKAAREMALRSSPDAGTRLPRGQHPRPRAMRLGQNSLLSRSRPWKKPG